VNRNGTTSPTSRSESSFGYVCVSITGAGATAANLLKLRKAGGGQLSSPLSVKTGTMRELELPSPAAVACVEFRLHPCSSCRCGGKAVLYVISLMNFE